MKIRVEHAEVKIAVTIDGVSVSVAEIVDGYECDDEGALIELGSRFILAASHLGMVALGAQPSDEPDDEDPEPDPADEPDPDPPAPSGGSTIHLVSIDGEESAPEPSFGFGDDSATCARCGIWTLKFGIRDDKPCLDPDELCPDCVQGNDASKARIARRRARLAPLQPKHNVNNQKETTP